MTLVEIMADIMAIHSTAKRYHWQCQGKEFYETHLFFDRIADVFHQGYVDTLAEAGYMNTRYDLEDLNKLDDIVAEKAGRKFDLQQLGLDNIELEMFKELYGMILTFKSKITTQDFDRGINAKIDELILESDQILGLLKARIAESTIDMVTARLNKHI